MTIKERLDAATEREAWAHLVKESAWVAKDEYFKKNPEKSMTFMAYKAGATSRDALIAKLAEALDIYANYLECVNPEFTRQGMLKYPSPKYAREALAEIIRALEEGNKCGIDS